MANHYSCIQANAYFNMLVIGSMFVTWDCILRFPNIYKAIIYWYGIILVTSPVPLAT